MPAPSTAADLLQLGVFTEKPPRAPIAVTIPAGAGNAGVDNASPSSTRRPFWLRDLDLASCDL